MRSTIKSIQDGHEVDWETTPGPFEVDAFFEPDVEQYAYLQEMLGEMLGIGAWRYPHKDEEVLGISPCFVVPKLKEGKRVGWRLCIDLRWLNFHVRKSPCKYEDVTQLPHMLEKGDWLLA